MLKADETRTQKVDSEESDAFLGSPIEVDESGSVRMDGDAGGRSQRMRELAEFRSHREAKEPDPIVRKMPPAVLKAMLDEEVMGQDAAKESLSLLVSMYLSWDPIGYPKQSPPNAVVVGPTGSGKTYSAEVASRQFGIPFHIIDSTTMVPAGAVNGNPVEMLRQRISYSEKCIVFLDEFDKLAARKDDTYKNWKDNVQRSLAEVH